MTDCDSQEDRPVVCAFDQVQDIHASSRVMRHGFGKPMSARFDKFPFMQTSPFLPPAIALSNRLDHTATFRTLQEIFQVPLLYAAKTGTNLSDLFKRAIQLSDPSLGPDETFRFTVSGVAPGKTNYFQFSSDVSGANPGTWQTLLTNVLITNRFSFADTNTSGSPRRFYRLVESY